VSELVRCYLTSNEMNVRLCAMNYKQGKRDAVAYFNDVRLTDVRKITKTQPG